MATRMTRQRQLVLDAVRSRTDHPSADDIYLDVRQKDDRISRGTIYRNLMILAESGEICHVRVPAADRYDLRLDKHCHMFCTGCGAVSDAPVPYQQDWDERVARETGFQIQRHRTIFEGLCPSCQAKAARNETAQQAPETDADTV